MKSSRTVQPSDILTFRYTAAYLVEGLQNPLEGPRLLYSDSEQSKKIYLTDQSYEGLHHIDTVHTLGNIFLTTMLQGKSWDFNAFTDYVSATNQERLKRYGSNAAFLIVEASHEEEAASIGTIAESDERNFCLALPNMFKDKVRELHKSFITKAQAFLSFGMPDVIGLQNVGDCIVADHPSGKPLYVMTFSMSANPTLLKPIPAGSLDAFAEFFTDPDDSLTLETATRLSADSLLNRRDNLRSFVFAFTALDSFLSKFYKQHKQDLLQLTEADLSTRIYEYVERIRDLMKTGQIGRTYPLGFRFALVASYLGLKDLDNMITKFDNAKQYRDDIAHGNPFDEAALPTAKVRNWLGELIRLRSDFGKKSSARIEPPT